jgi:lauroyl/myristoyl acyltransferase
MRLTLRRQRPFLRYFPLQKMPGEYRQNVRQAKEIFSLLIDQGNGDTALELLGNPTRWNLSLARHIRAYQRPVVLFVIVPGPEQSWVIEWKSLQSTEAIATECGWFFEKWIREFPTLWIWHYPKQWPGLPAFLRKP